MISWVHYLLAIYLEQMTGPLDQADKSKFHNYLFRVKKKDNILFLGIDNAKEPIIKVPSWEVGAFCRGVFKEDGLEYEG